MATVVKEFFFDQNLTVPAGVTEIFWEMSEDPEASQKFASADYYGLAAIYARSNGWYYAAGTQTYPGQSVLGAGDTTGAAHSSPVLADPFQNLYKPVVASGNTTTGSVATAVYAMSKDAGAGLRVWGYNGYGELGDGTTVSKSSPVSLSFTNPYPPYSVSADNNSVLCVQRDGTLLAWGYNTSGQLGDGTNVSKSTPVIIMSGTKFLDAKTFNKSSVAIDTNGNAYSWGVTPAVTGVNNSSPVLISGIPKLNGIYGVGSLFNNARAVMLAGVDKTVWTYGSNQNGILGQGLTDGNLTVNHPVPGQITQPAGQLGYPVQYQANFFNMGYLTSRGQVVMWGDNQFGTCGDGTSGNLRSTPVAVLGHTFTDFSLGNQFLYSAGSALALKADGSVWSWGYDMTLQGHATSTPTMISASGQYYCAIKNMGTFYLALQQDGSLWGYGQNNNGQMATGGTTNLTAFTKLKPSSDSAQGGPGAITHSYAVPRTVMTGAISVAPGQILRVCTGPMPMIGGHAITVPSGYIASTSGGSYLPPFARRFRVWWYE